MKQKIYSLDKRIPYELSVALAKAIDDRDRCASMIKSYTDDWVKYQIKIIELNKAIEKLKEEK